jgi:hypothetical protein
VQAPLVQDWPVGHLCPQVPQLFSSDFVSVHFLSHTVATSVGHVHFPATHVAPSAQVLPQAPQFLVSVCSSIHPTPLQ